MENNVRKRLNEHRKEKKEKVFFIVGTLIFLFFLLFIIFNNLDNYALTNTQTINTETLTLEEKFAVLSVAQTNSCGGGAAVVYKMPEDGKIQGSCCTKMNLHKYQEQLEGLEQKYSEYEIIPKDPYDVPVSWAREMIEYNENTQLNSEQQVLYDNAMKISDEGGPCCCICWHWYAYEGLAKKLIVEEGFSAEQIAEIWELSDACGGAGHKHEDSGGH